jgi:hypothetical protein
MAAACGCRPAGKRAKTLAALPSQAAPISPPEAVTERNSRRDNLLFFIPSHFPGAQASSLLDWKYTH